LTVAGLIAFAAIAVLASHASATTASGTDPLHDNPDGYDSRGDVTAFSLSYTTPSVSVSTTVATFDNPATSPNWIVNPSGILFGLDTTNDQNPEYILAYFNDGLGNVTANVFTNAATPAFLCTATPSFSSTSRSYTASFSPSCIGNPATLSLGIIFGYFTNTTVSFDDTSFTSAVSATTTTTTTSHPTTTTTQATTTTTHTTTTTAAPTTTTSTSTTTTTTVPVGQVQVHSSGTNTNACVTTLYIGPESNGNVLVGPSQSAVGMTIAGDLFPEPHLGDPIQLTNTTLAFDIPGDVLQSAANMSPPLITDGMQVPSTVNLAVAASNTLEGSHAYVANGTTTIHVAGGIVQPLAMTSVLPDTVWHPQNNLQPVEFTETSTKISLSMNILGGITAVFQCNPAPSLQIGTVPASEGSPTTTTTTLPPTTTTTTSTTTVPRSTTTTSLPPTTSVPPPTTVVPPPTTMEPPPTTIVPPPTTDVPMTTPTTSPVATTTVTAAAVTTTTVVGATQQATTGSLPRTGASWALLLAVAAAAIDVGIALVGATWRRVRS
jgi:hypothetical protein